MPKSRTAESSQTVNVQLTFKETTELFSCVVSPFYIPLQYMGLPAASFPCQHRVWSFFKTLDVLIGVSCYFTVILIFTSLMTNNLNITESVYFLFKYLQWWSVCSIFVHILKICFICYCCFESILYILIQVHVCGLSFNSLL